MGRVRAHVIVEGRVQGVYYRSYAEDEAARLGITGWVSNRRDGRVEAVFEGEEGDVKAMIAWCRQGSPLARVDNVTVEWGTYEGEYRDFSVTYRGGGV